MFYIPVFFPRTGAICAPSNIGFNASIKDLKVVLAEKGDLATNENVNNEQIKVNDSPMVNFELYKTITVEYIQER